MAETAKADRGVVGLPPGPRMPRSLQLAYWALRPDVFLRRAARRYGSVFTLRLGMLGDAMIISDPALVKEVFTGDPAVLHAGSAAALLKPVVGRWSILLLDDEPHLSQRRLILPPFHGSRMEAYREIIRNVTSEAVSRWPRGKPVSLRPLMADITLDVVMQAIFGVSDDRQRPLRSALQRMLDQNAAGSALLITRLQRDLGRFSPWGRFLRARAIVDELLFEEIRMRRLVPDLDARQDVLSLLLQARHEDGTPMSDQELRDELVTLLVAGHETTASALSWVFELLFRSPEAYDRVVQEAREGDGFDFADAVIRESLRLRPIIPMVARRLTQPFQLGDFLIPAGAAVAPCILLVHRRPDLYPDPDEFRPERFLGRDPGTYDWLPFGGGMRRCVGASFALFEMRIVLQEILAATELRQASSRPEAVRARSITLVPQHGTRAIIGN